MAHVQGLHPDKNSLVYRPDEILLNPPLDNLPVITMRNFIALALATIVTTGIGCVSLGQTPAPAAAPTVSPPPEETYMLGGTLACVVMPRAQAIKEMAEDREFEQLLNGVLARVRSSEPDAPCFAESGPRTDAYREAVLKLLLTRSEPLRTAAGMSAGELIKKLGYKDVGRNFEFVGFTRRERISTEQVHDLKILDLSNRVLAEVRQAEPDAPCFVGNNYPTANGQEQNTAVLSLLLARSEPLRAATGMPAEELAKKYYSVGSGADFSFTKFSESGPVIEIFIKQ